MHTRERGAVAVEMALLLPVLILLLLGIMEFGRAYNAQITLTNAAREGVRVMALTNSQSQATIAARNAAAVLMPAPTATNSTVALSTNPASSPASCTYVVGQERKQVTLTFTYQLTTLTGIAGPFTLTGRGTMLCGG